MATTWETESQKLQGQINAKMSNNLDTAECMLDITKTHWVYITYLKDEWTPGKFIGKVWEPHFVCLWAICAPRATS